MFKTALDVPEIKWSLSNDIQFKTSKDKSKIYFDISTAGGLSLPF